MDEPKEPNGPEKSEKSRISRGDLLKTAATGAAPLVIGKPAAAAAARRLFAAALIGCVAGLLTLPMALIGPVAPAVASSGCPGNQSVLPYSGNNPAFQCAQMDSSGKKTLDPLQTKTWTNTVPFGYNTLYHCESPNDKDVTVTAATASASYSATGTNWGTSQHSFGAGVLFTTGNVDSSYPASYPPGSSPPSYVKGCNNQGQIETSISKVVSSLTLTGAFSTGTVGVPMTITASISPASATGYIALTVDNSGVAKAAISNGIATLYWTPTSAGTHTLSAGYQGDVSACPSYNDTCGYSPAASPNYTAQVSDPSTATLAAFRSASAPTTEPNSVQPSTSAGTLPNFQLVALTMDAVPPFSLTCPAGYILMYPETFSDNGGFIPVAAGVNGARVLSVPAGQDVTQSVELQVTCRAADAPLLISGSLGFGTQGNDQMTTTQDHQILFGGPGNDHLTVQNTGSIAFGGPGNNTIVVSAPDGIGKGGPGNDVLMSTTQGRSLLIGGGGHDVLMGSSTGETFMSAVDGQPDDVVICHSSLNKVIADQGDKVEGPCGTIILLPR